MEWKEGKTDERKKRKDKDTTCGKKKEKGLKICFWNVAGVTNVKTHGILRRIWYNRFNENIGGRMHVE